MVKSSGHKNTNNPDVCFSKQSKGVNILKQNFQLKIETVDQEDDINETQGR